jgi:uncharacterized small protein (DUF1192 family)
VDNSYFNPRGFGVGGTAALGLATAAAVHSIAGNIAAAVHERRQAMSDQDIHDTLTEILENNEQAMRTVNEQSAMIAVLTATIEHLQAELRRRG